MHSFLYILEPQFYKNVEAEIYQDKTRQDKTRQDKTRQDKTRQDKTRQDKTRQDKTRQDKTRQDKTRQDKTRQDKTRQDKTRQDKTRQDKDNTLFNHATPRNLFYTLILGDLACQIRKRFNNVLWSWVINLFPV